MKLGLRAEIKRDDQSHPARGAWIEISSMSNLLYVDSVAPRKGCVD